MPCALRLVPLAQCSMPYASFATDNGQLTGRIDRDLYLFGGLPGILHREILELARIILPVHIYPGYVGHG